MSKENSILDVEGMSCQHCVNAVKSAVGELDGVEVVEVDLTIKKVSVDYDSSIVSLQKIKDAIEDQGYDVV